jgi:retinol dehydrogenase-12
MQGKVVLITGATAGIGKETARGIARLGAHVLVSGRSREKCEAVVAELRSATGNAAIDPVVADLSSMAEVRGLAQEVLSRHERLDVLINNAGAINMARELTAEGFERTFAANHLAYFLLANLLLPALERGAIARSAPSRIINVSSEAHRGSPIDFDDLHAERGYFSFGVYGRSKLCNLLFTRELARRVDPSKVTVNALHPGIVASSFMGAKPGTWGMLGRLANRFLISNETGARTSIYLATAPEVAGVTGRYFKGLREARPSRAAHDDEVARRLWEVSARLVGLGP